MKRYERHLLIGTTLGLIGVILIYKLNIGVFFGWFVLVFGKLIILLSIMEYVDYKRAFRGEDLTQDYKYKRMIRKVRKKYYK